MTIRKDDMVIRPRFGQPKLTRSPRARAQQDRMTDRVRKKKKLLRRKLRRAIAIRQLSRRGRQARTAAKWSTKGLVRGVGYGIRGGGAVLTVVALLIEGVKWFHDRGRQVEGKSKRLIAAEDAHAFWGYTDENVTANAAGLAYLLQDATALRGFAQEGQVTSSVLENAHYVRLLAKQRAMGADMIARDPYFDSPASVADLIMQKANKARLKWAVDKMIGKMRELGYGRVRSTR
jgi:hypothetical protein